MTDYATMAFVKSTFAFKCYLLILLTSVEKVKERNTSKTQVPACPPPEKHKKV